uniref:TraB domain-containing protein n=1 Tax=Pyramimonas obovata TaxID=1411642 RepID=A0A7S0RN77_9CHLO|mmetsp:Transcript_38702/g.84180  ORF Transcript_38702/g.84180 Transcript_38702/m.84180 type:complete len:317 (+) Transcript_38702:73-1023(+)
MCSGDKATVVPETSVDGDEPNESNPFNTKNVSLLEYKTDNFVSPSKVYLLGTAHISKESTDDVRALIDAVKPDCVVLELCRSRKGLLAMRKTEVPSFADMVKLYKEGRQPLWGILYSWTLAQLGSKMEVMPGEEFRVAYEAAADLGAHVVLGDRPVQVTLKRTWAALTVREKVKFLWEVIALGSFSMSAEDLKKMVEELKDTDMITQAIKELGQEFPSLVRPLITERDLYLVHSLRQVAANYQVVVGVVGAGHCPGIRDNWTEEIDVDELVRLPPEDESSLLVAAAYEWRWSIAATVAVAAGVGTTLLIISRRRWR